MTGPLSGVRVLEFGGLGPAPFAVMMLARAGADVIRVDRPGTGPSDDALIRGRPVLALDLKSKADRDQALELASKADILIESFRPGVMERLDLGPAQCFRSNARLIYCRMTGWGQSGPRAREAGHDINYLALTGALRSVARHAQAPVPPVNFVGDYGGGGMVLAFGIVTALLERNVSGQGQVIDAAMVDGISLLMTDVWSRAARGLWTDEPGTNTFDSGAPFYDVYETADGQYMAVGSVEPQFWQRLLDVLTIDRADMPTQWERQEWPKMKQRIAAVFKTRSRAAWTEAFSGIDACVNPVLSLQEAAKDAHLFARQTLRQDGNGVIPAAAPRLERTPIDGTSSETLEITLRRWGAGHRLSARPKETSCDS